MPIQPPFGVSCTLEPTLPFERFASFDPTLYNTPACPAFLALSHSRFQMTIPTMHSPQNASPAPNYEALRLRLLTLLSIYDLIPYSISHPPGREEPLDITSVIDAPSLQRCLASLVQQGVLTPEESQAFARAYRCTGQDSTARSNLSGHTTQQQRLPGFVGY